ncbi:hypothetical protein NIA71_08720 [Ihubacter massiliensis]|uniref:hypothetical protein n=1 Tax=Ihubacter massiliensis TaxID=1852367 RepID=UPI00209740FF|nr:hypothetical protein [Ihubacter massiliensis]MCO7122030.1 hypothetical protein [Ihubacter massiliensis]
MTKILAPNQAYTGTSAGVAFLNGKGETDDSYLIEWFKAHGYEIEDDAESKMVEPQNEQDETQEENLSVEIVEGSENLEQTSKPSKSKTQKAGKK